MSVVRRACAVVAAVAVMVVAAGGAALAAVSDVPARTWGTNGRVLAILPVGDRVYVAGTFTAVIDPSSRTYPVSNVAVFVPSTGRFDTTWSAGTDATVTSLATADGQLFMGGPFTKVNGVNRKKLAKVALASGALDTTWQPSVDRQPDVLTTFGGQVYVGGLFTQAAGTGKPLAARPYLARFATTTGALDPSWLPVPDDRVLSMAVSYDGISLFAGGSFTSVNGAANTGRIVKLSVATGAVTPGFVPGATNLTTKPPIYDITVSGPDRLYLAVAGSGGACASMSPSTGSVLWSKHANGNLQGVRVVGGTVFCGGHFTGDGGFDGQTRYKVAAVDAATGQTLPYAPVVNSALGVWSMGADATHVYLGGDFTKVGATEQPQFAMFTDSSARTVAGPPESLSAAPGDAVVLLTWSIPSTDGGDAIQRYRVYRAPAGSGAWSVATSTTTPNFSDATVTNDTTYDYRVTAVNAQGESLPSATVTSTPAANSATPPGVPSGFGAVGQYGAVLLTWTAPISGGSAITGYRIYRGTSAGSEILTDSVSGPATSYTDRAVTIGSRYYYRVAAVNAIGEGGLSTEESGVPTDGTPSAPVLSGTAAPGGITLTWTPPARDGGSPVTKYVLLRDGIRLAILTATTLAYTDTDVVRGTSYTYRLKAQNALGASPLSVPVVVTAS